MATSNPDEQLSAVVLLAHGPATTTLTALRRLEQVEADTGARIHVLAGTEPGLTAIDRASDRGVDVTADHGPTVLRSTIERMQGTVAVVHDDAVVSAEDLRTLVAAHGQSGLVAVAPPTAATRTTTLESAPLAKTSRVM